MSIYNDLKPNIISCYFPDNRNINLTPENPSIFVFQWPVGQSLIQSGEFYFSETLCNFTLFLEIKISEKDKFQKISEKMNTEFENHRLGKTLFKLGTNKNRLFLQISYFLKLPNEKVKCGIKGLMRDFYQDMEGYEPVWSGREVSVDYKSLWIKPEKEGGYRKLDGWIRVGDKLKPRDFL